MSIPAIPDKAFPPGENDPCYCGSGRAYGQCCGAGGDDRPPPFGIGVREDFLSPDECGALLALAHTKPLDPYKVRNPDGSVSPDPTRVCERVVFGDDQQVLDNLVRRAWRDVIIPGTGVDIAWYEQPQLLKYETGGFYYYHADNAYLDIERQVWRKSVDRDLSLLIYLSDDFEGGDLHFSRLGYSLQPKAGMLAWFPSDMRFQHAARPVTGGTRYAVVSWAAAVAMERVKAERPKRSIDWVSGEKQPETGAS